MKTQTHEKILGYDWSAIQAAQQGNASSLRGALAPSDAALHKKQIESDVARFKISVAREIVDAYAIILPDGYSLDGDTFKFQP